MQDNEPTSETDCQRLSCSTSGEEKQKWSSEKFRKLKLSKHTSVYEYKVNNEPCVEEKQFKKILVVGYSVMHIIVA